MHPAARALPLPAALAITLAACGGGGAAARAPTAPAAPANGATATSDVVAGRDVVLNRDVITFVQDLAWSPDSSTIAFSLRRISRAKWDGDRTHALANTQYDVYLIGADGRGLRQLTDSAEDEVWLSWYPDGKKLAFSSVRDGEEAIYTLALDGADAGVVKRLTPPAGGSADAAWAPDGRHIVYSARADAHTQLYSATLIGTDVRQLTHEAFDCRGPVWSPDGRQLVFQGNPRGTGKEDIFMMDVGTAAVTALTRDDVNDIYPAWMPDGWVTFTTAVGERKRIVRRAPLSDKRETIVDDAFFGRVSPDGRSIAYLSGAFPDSALYVRAIDPAAKPQRLVE